jgi:sugar phosphate isomerase/epimerase
MKPRIACRPHSYRPYEAEAYAHLAGLGVRHVEISLPAEDAVESTLAELQAHGLTVTSVHGECELSDAKIAAQIRRQMPILKALDCPLLFVSARADDLPLETAYERLRAAGDVAGEMGVTIVMETHPDLITNAEVACRTMEAVNHPHVRVNYDTANVYFYNKDIDSVSQLEQVAPFVAAVHLKETNGGYHDWHFPALGAGIVDFPAIFAVLDRIRFDGPCTMEIEGIEGEDATHDLILGRVADSVAYLKKIDRF